MLHWWTIKIIESPEAVCCSWLLKAFPDRRTQRLKMTYDDKPSKNGNGSEIQDCHVTTEGTKPVAKGTITSKWRALVMLGGLYGMVLSVMGLVVPFTYFLYFWSHQDFHYFYVFYAYVYLVSLAFMIYVSVATRVVKGKTTHDNGIPLPSVIPGKEGVNIYLTFAIVAFAALTILLQILMLIAFAQDPLQFRCYGYGQIAVSLFIILFALAQMIFFLGHAKTIFNFQPVLMKIGFIHLIAANMSTWGLASIFQAGELYLQRHRELAHEHSEDLQETLEQLTGNTTGSPITKYKAEPFVLICLGLKTTAVKGSPYLIPFMVEFSLIAVGILYSMLKNVGTTPRHQHLKLINKTAAEEFGERTCIRSSCITLLHLVFVFGAVAVAIVEALLTEDILELGEDHFTARATIFFGCQYALLTLSIIFTLGAFYHTRKLHYMPKNREGFYNEVLLLVSLGAFYFLIAFVMIATSCNATKQKNTPRSSLYIMWAVLNYVQSTIQVVFIRDGLRRVALTRSAVNNHLSRNLINMNIACNEGLWIVTSFMVKGMADDPLMTSFYSSLTWIVVVSLFLPLAIFFRFHSGSCLAEIQECLYHETCFIGKRQINTKHWEHKE